jgi:hypothetical protein
MPVMGAAGLFSLAGGVGVAAASTGGPAADLPLQKVTPSHEIILGEEELSDVSLATFYVIDKENAAAVKSGIRIARGCGGCGGCGGHGGCGHGGCGGCGHGCGGCGHGGCGIGCRCGGWWGCAGGCGGCGCCLSVFGPSACRLC